MVECGVDYRAGKGLYPAVLWCGARRRGASVSFTPVTSATPQWSPSPASGQSSISDPRLLMGS